jgi:hypothetical protein
MKYFTRKITLGLVATTLSLSAKTPLPAYSTLAMDKSTLQESVLSTPFKQKRALKASDPKVLLANLRHGEASLEKAILIDTHAKDELKALQKIYKKLVADYAALSEEAQKLKLEQAILCAENDAFKEEKKSFWERFKNWMFNLDSTKVVTSVITGTCSIIAALIAILI